MKINMRKLQDSIKTIFRSARGITMIIGACSLLPACTQIDNYMLGKDNTPIPRALAPIKPTVMPEILWSQTIGKSNKSLAYLKLKPVVKNEIFTADESGIITALNKKNGHILWSTNLHTKIVSGPSVAEGYLAVGTGNAELVVLKQETGKEVWRANLSEDALSKSPILKHTIFSKTIDGHVHAFALANGKSLWVSDHGAPNLILKASSSPVFVGGLILVGFSDGKLDALNLDTGSVVWQRSIAFATGASDVERLVDIDADPIVRGNLVYLASYQGFIGALNLNDGQFIWNRAASIYKNMAIDEHVLYVVDSQDILWAFDKQTGQVIWKQTGLKARGVTEPVLVGKSLVVADKTGYLHVIAKENGEMIGRLQLSGAISISPAASGQMVYVMSAKGILQAVRLRAV